MPDTETLEDWYEIKAAHIEALKSVAAGVDASFTVAGRTYSYKSVEDIEAFLNMCDRRILSLQRKSSKRPFGSIGVFRKS